jgi:hypothetical protein
LQKGYWFALFPVWFFAIASIANGIAHPVLAVGVGGYFTGLIHSPVVGVLGVFFLSRPMKSLELRWPRMNADQCRLKTTNLRLHYRCSSASIGGHIAFFSTLLD